MTLIPLKDANVNGVSLSVTFSDVTNQFTIATDDWNVTDATYDGVVAKARRQVKRAKARIAIPATYLENGHAVPILITGKHEKTGHYLARYTETEKAVRDLRSHIGLLRPMTVEERVEYRRLFLAHHEAERALVEFVRERKENVGRKVEEELANAVNKED